MTLSGNPCINTNFDYPDRIQELSQIATKLCKYCEIAADATESNDCQTNLKIISDNLEKCKTDLEFCKFNSENHQKTHEQVVSVLEKVIEELRREKQNLAIENEKNKKMAGVLEKQLSMRDQNSEHTTTASESLDDFALG